ncbi:hypothetical protein FB45DRAFT_1063053 [Roridomyces roridus]|uniref:Cellobiose dehydrogenase cytochrome domain-containing protein n=1 Tax=Roridomyces roridus TaxID=1738132 RepID=A0AAD7FEW0_9AGAR|nr:hypothetical protein FB45DRAFT_1068995 [Roridomyces roridus]KAJ7619735.1 hypothetical protein FB45DRAFT_1063053 [Roridomyces roridus]
MVQGYNVLPMMPLTSFTLFSILSLGNARATLINLTIDDTNSSHWTFIGPDWNAVTPEAPCTKCALTPNPALVYNTTWHDGTLLSGIFTFEGSAVYIYGIDPPTKWATNISFEMNSITSSHFRDGGSQYIYDSLFFSVSNLDSNGPHILKQQLDEQHPSNSLPVQSLRVPNTTERPLGVAAIIGVTTAIGGLVVLFIFLMALIFLCLRRTWVLEFFEPDGHRARPGPIEPYRIQLHPNAEKLWSTSSAHRPGG